MSRRWKRAFSLVEMLVVVVIIMILAAFLLPKYLKGGTTPEGRRVEAPMDRARSVDCQNNLNQIRLALQMASQTGEEARPRTLAELRTYGITEPMMQCPVGKVPYAYDAAMGRVWCPHQGHQGY